MKALCSHQLVIPEVCTGLRCAQRLFRAFAAVHQRFCANFDHIRVRTNHHPNQLQSSNHAPLQSSSPVLRESVLPTASQHSDKSRLSTPSPSVVPLLKAYRPSPTTAVLSSTLTDMHEIDHESATVTPSHELNADGRMRAALKDALPYMQCFYELLTNSHNTHASTLAANTQAVAENTRVLNSLTSCVDVVEKSQQTLNNGHDADGRMRTALKDVPLYMQ